MQGPVEEAACAPVARDSSGNCRLLESTDAYRRDRRKDQLLQQNNYFVLRFLAEDVGKNLDMVLDTIQRTLFSRQKQ